MVFGPVHQMTHQMRISQVGAGHADQIDNAFTDRMAGGGGVADAPGVDQRQGHFLAKMRDRRQIGRIGLEHAGHVVLGQDQVAVHPPIDRVKEIQQPFALEHLRQRDTVVGGQPAGRTFVDDQTDTNGKVRPHSVADCFVHHQPETGAVFQRSAKCVGAPVGKGRHELTDQVAPAQGFHTVQPAILRAFGGTGVIGDHPVDVVTVHLARKAAAAHFADGRGGDHGGPVAVERIGATAQMRDLGHHRGTLIVHARRQGLQIGNDAVAAEIQLAAAPA